MTTRSVAELQNANRVLAARDSTRVTQPKRTDDRGGGGSTDRVFILKAVAGDSLVCRTLDWDDATDKPVEGTENVLVAKEWKLRVTPFDQKPADSLGLVYVYNAAGTFRTAAIPNSSKPPQKQFLIPAYQTGEEIVAVKVKGGSPVKVAGKKLVWVERDERRWFAAERVTP